MCEAIKKESHMSYSPEERAQVLAVFGSAPVRSASTVTFNYITFKTGLSDRTVARILSDLLFDQEIRIEITSGTSFCTFYRAVRPTPKPFMPAAVPAVPPTPFDNGSLGDLYINKGTGALVVFRGIQRMPTVELRYIPVRPDDSADTVTVRTDTEWCQQFTRIWPPPTD